MGDEIHYEVSSCQDPACGKEIVGLRSDAKFCSRRCGARIKARRWHAVKPEVNRERCKRYANTEKGRAVLLLKNAKDRAKRQGVPYELDLDFVLERLRFGKCEITGLEFELSLSKKYKANPLGPSLDRIIPSKGYTKENVRMVCFGINVMHHDWSDDLMLRFAEKIVENKDKLSRT